MADSKMANEAEETFTLMKQSCAYRVKYAVKDKDGKREITKKNLFSTGCHTGNRGGVHPQGQRVKTLSQKVTAPDMGWDQEEVSFGGCVVQEVPEDRRPRGYVTYHEWALLECKNSTLLFPINEGQLIKFGSLAHGHIALVLKGCMLGARFEIEGISAVAGEAIGCIDRALWQEKYPEMYKAALEGLPSETLAWEMNIEEPSAANTISLAFNNKNRMALLPTEMECIGHLSLEIDMQKGGELAHSVSFQSCKEALRSKLHHLVDEPDFIKVFKFVLELGAGAECFIPYLKSWYGKYVNPDIRKLRLENFGQAGGFNRDEPWLKIAHILWAYRQTPQKDHYCPMLQTKQLELGLVPRTPMNTMLNFWHGPLRDHAARHGMVRAELEQYTANADFLTVEAVYQGINSRPQKCNSAASVEAAVGVVLGDLWSALRDRIRVLTDDDDHELPEPPFKIVAPAATAKAKAKAKGKAKAAPSAVAESEDIRANIPTFAKDRDGQIFADNDDLELFKGAKKGKVTFTAAAPAEWVEKTLVRNSVNDDFDAGMIEATLAALHADLPHEQDMNKLKCVGLKEDGAGDDDAPATSRNQTKYIEVLTPIAKGGLVLWALPGNKGVALKPFDEAAVVARPTANWAVYKITARGAASRDATYTLTGQWQELAHDPAVAGSRVFDGAEKMHMYWKVRRSTSKTIAEDKKARLAGDKKVLATKPIVANMTMGNHDFYHGLTAALPSKQSMQRTTVVTVPYLTNNCDLVAGDILTLEVDDEPDKAPQTRRGRTWVSQETQKAKRQKRAAADGDEGAPKDAKNADVMEGMVDKSQITFL